MCDPSPSVPRWLPRCRFWWCVRILPILCPCLQKVDLCLTEMDLTVLREKFILTLVKMVRNSFFRTINILDRCQASDNIGEILSSTLRQLRI